MNLRQKCKKLKKENERLKVQNNLLDAMWGNPAVPITRGYDVEMEKIMSRHAIPMVDVTYDGKTWAKRAIAKNMANFMYDNDYIRYTEAVVDTNRGPELVITGHAYVGKEK